MRQEGLPSHSLWGCPMGKKHALYVHEDNQAMLAVTRSGRNPTVRYSLVNYAPPLFPMVSRRQRHQGFLRPTKDLARPTT
eukprot:10718374-Alexandrium_andersonii.AAC.1